MVRDESQPDGETVREGEPRAGRELCFLEACELARMIRRKEVSAREVLVAHLEQIERVNPRVNAIVTLVAEQAMEQAQRADEALGCQTSIRIAGGVAENFR